MSLFGHANRFNVEQRSFKDGSFYLMCHVCCKHHLAILLMSNVTLFAQLSVSLQARMTHSEKWSLT